MKNKILLTIASALLTSFAYAGHGAPAVPDSGSTLGALAIAGLAVIALRRKVSK